MNYTNNAFNRTAIPLILGFDERNYPSAKRATKQQPPRGVGMVFFCEWLDSICPTDNVNYLMLKLVKKQFRLQV
jgi:hypothetical protein